MGMIRISAEARLAAPAADVYAVLADYRHHHPRILPPAFTSFGVEEGGVGAGTIIRFTVQTGGRTLHYRQRVEEPEPGRVLVERDLEKVATTTFTVLPDGEGSSVRIDTAWQAGGVRGVIERLLAPRMLTSLYRDELARLEAYALALHGASAAEPAGAGASTPA